MAKIDHPDLAEVSLAQVLSALGDPVRLRIVQMAADEPQPCHVFQGKLSKSTLSHHMKILREAGDQLRQIHALFVERINAGVADFDGADVALFNLPVRLAAAREFKIDALFQQRRGDDENNEQHECKVEQRRDVDFAQRHEMTAL